MELPPESQTEGPGQSSSPGTTAPATSPAPAAPVPDAPAYRDRRTGLIVFGVFQIVMGLLAALMIPFLMLGAFMSRLTPGAAMRPGQYISGVATYAFLAAALLALGIGSTQAKRWAYALTLVTSWYWLIIGALITVLITAVLPVTFRSVLSQAQPGTSPPGLSTNVMAVMLTVIIVFATFFLVLVPLAYVIFYTRKDVAETCRHRDPVERWTDRTPLPVLGASVVLFTGALYMLLTGATLPVFPFFGQYLTGVAAAVCFLVLAAVDICVAVALFRRQPWGWWIAVLSTPIRLLSMALTYRRADMMQAYSKMGWSDAQLQMLNASPMFHSHVILWWSLMALFLFFGYLVWLKRYFKTPAAPQQEPLPA